MGGERYVHLAARDGSRFTRFASIRSQCARHRFYGDKRTEDWLHSLEDRHAPVFRAVLDIAWNKRTATLSDEEDRHLREAILLQRSRTPRNARIYASMTDEMILYAYREYLESLPTTPERQAAIKAIQQGKAAVRDSQFITGVLQIGDWAYFGKEKSCFSIFPSQAGTSLQVRTCADSSRKSKNKISWKNIGPISNLQNSSYQFDELDQDSSSRDGSYRRSFAAHSTQPYDHSIRHGRRTLCLQ